MTVKKVQSIQGNADSAYVCSGPTSCIGGMCPACDPGRCNSRVDGLKVDIKTVYSK